MPGVADMNVRIGADMSELVTGVNKAKAKVVELVTTEDDLKRKIVELNAALAKNDSAIEAVNKELASLKAEVKQSSAAIAILKAEMKAMSETNIRLSANLESTKAELAGTVARVEALTVAQQQAEVAGSGFTRGLGSILGGLKGVSKIIPGLGFAALATLVAGPVIDAFSEWFDAINEVSDALKTMKANQDNLNDIFSKSNQEASKQITNLQVLYKAATDVTLSMKERLSAVKGLQNEFPDYFKNLKAESILNGDSKSAYDALTTSIIKAARAKAAIGKLDEIAAKQLDNDIQRQKIINATTNEAARARDKVLKQQTTGSSLTGGGAGGSEVTITREEQLKIIEARKQAALKIVEINAKSLQSQADFITKFIGISDLAKSVETEIKTPKVKKDTESVKHVETISDVLQKLAIQIDFLNQKEILLKTDQSQAKINAIEGTINTLMQKFKLLADNPVIIKLQAQVSDINLKEQFKKDAVDRKKEKLEVPVEFIPEKNPDYQAFDSVRYNLIKELERYGVKKTKIGIPITTANNKELQDTLDETKKRLQDIADLTTQTLSPAFDALFEGILSGSQNAFQSFGQALEQTIVKLGAAVLKAAAFAAILSALTPGLSFSGAFKKILGFSDGGAVKGFAGGGYISGPGTKTSDSIPAWLSNGEFVIKSDIVSKLGLNFFEKLNKGMMPKFSAFGIPKFAAGGFVSPNLIRTAQVPSLSGVAIGGGQTITIRGNFELRNDRLVAAVKRGNAQISRNS